jgi:hypothetical protein
LFKESFAMPDEPKKDGNPIPTEGFPIVYANLASVTANYNDLRLYFADQFAKTVATTQLPAGGPSVVSEAVIAPRICLVLTPEFAKSVLAALSTTIAQYEKAFGALRPVPQPPPAAGKSEERPK